MLTDQLLEGLYSSSSEELQRQEFCQVRRAWGEIFRENVNLANISQVLGNLKRQKHLIQIHPLEKDLIYLSAISISKRSQLFISFPVSPVSLGILLAAYYAHLPQEKRDIYHIHHAVFAKDYMIWVRPQDTGQISTLRITKAFNLVDPCDPPKAFNLVDPCDPPNNLSDKYPFFLSEQIICLPVYRFDESSKSKQLRIVIVRSLSEAIEFLKQSNYCSFVLLDDPSGKTYPSPSSLGEKAFDLASICKDKKIPMVGIVPPWIMKNIEYFENKNCQEIKLWPIDFFALCSYPAEVSLFRKCLTPHPIEESFLLLQRKRYALSETQVIIKTFDFEGEDKERIAELFKETSDLLIDLAKQPNLRNIWTTGWEIWRHLSAPVLPFHHLWGNFLESTFKRLQLASNKSKEAKALILYNSLNSLVMRLSKLKYNPFIEVIQAADQATIVAVENAERANALEQFLIGKQSYSSIPEILPISQIYGLGGEKLIVIGQPKACYRDTLQTTFFQKIDVLLWSVLSERAGHWWSNLEVDAREWHQKTWLTLTEKKEVGCYSFSPQYKSVQVVTTGKAKLSKRINLSKLEESFSTLTRTGLDSGLSEAMTKNLDSYYLIEFQLGRKIRVTLGSEFLVLSDKQVHPVAVKELTAGTKVVLFDGMNRDELFAQKAGLLEDTKVNYLYRVQLDAWREIVKKQVKSSNLKMVCRQIFSDTGLPISEETIQHNWIRGDNFLSLPREREHFFWFIPPLAHSGFEDFWQQANELRIKRRQLGQIISTCAQEGWKNRKPNEIVFQYQQVFITVGELQEAMEILKVQFPPKLISHPPKFPFNRLFRE